MGYVDQALLPGETIVYRGRLHWIVFSSAWTFLALGIFILLGLPVARDRESFVALLGLGAVVLFVFVPVCYVTALIRQRTTELAVTSRRIIAKFGVIRRSTIELNHAKVEGLRVDQSILGRLLDYGTLHIHGTGGGTTPVAAIAAPLEFRRRAMEVVDTALEGPVGHPPR